jgi:hypothetical protein
MNIADFVEQLAARSDPPPHILSRLRRGHVTIPEAANFNVLCGAPHKTFHVKRFVM